MADTGGQQWASGNEFIEGGSVEGLEDLQIEERKHRAATARALAYCLVGILAGTVAIQYGLTMWLVLLGKDAGVSALDKLFNALLPVISGLVGGAVTFYFTKEKN